MWSILVPYSFLILLTFVEMPQDPPIQFINVLTTLGTTVPYNSVKISDLSGYKVASVLLGNNRW